MSNDDSARDGEAAPNPAVRLLQAVTPRPIRENFTLKFALVLVVMALLIGALGLYGTSQITAETENRVTEEFTEATLQNADTVDEWIVSHEVSTRLLSADDIWGGNTPQPIEDMTAELNFQQEATGDDIHGLHLVELSDGGPQAVASTSIRTGTSLGDSDRPYLSDTSAIDGLDTDDVYVSDLYSETGTPVIAFVSPTEAREDGYLVTEVQIAEIGNSLAANSDRQVSVVNASNTVVISGDNGEVPSSYADNEEALRPIREARELRDDPDRSAGVITDMPADPAVIDGTYTVGYAPIESVDWVVLVHSPRSEEFGFADTLSSWGLLVTAGAVLLIGVIGAVMGYSTSTSIDRLARKAERIGDGDLDAPIHTTRVDNIGRLYGSFDEMRTTLKQQIQEAENARREAENARKEAEVARAEAQELATYLQEKAGEYSDVMGQVGAGDLTQRMDQDGEEESMDRIAGEFNEMINELEKTIGQLKEYVDEVDTAGEEVEGSAETVRQASEQIAESIQKISDDAYDQQEKVQAVVESTDSVAADLERIAAEADDQELEGAAERIGDLVADLEAIESLSEEMMGESQQVAGASEEQAAELAEVSERANDLQRFAEPLRDILQEFETDQEHEFVFSIGPTGSEQPLGSDTGDDE